MPGCEHACVACSSSVSVDDGGAGDVVSQLL